MTRLQPYIIIKVEPKTSGCWIWTGSKNRRGYGVLHAGWLGCSSLGAHRAAYEAFREPIPSGLEIDHLCRNKSCVNPDHLETVTRSENVRRAVPFRKYTLRGLCRKGHPLDGSRTREVGGRYCKTCNRLNKQRSRKGLSRERPALLDNLNLVSQRM